MKIFVTGASGHIGNNLVRALLEQKRDVRVLIYDKDPNVEGLKGLDVEKVQGDILDYEHLKKSMEGAEVVFHLAARISIIGPENGFVHRVNVDGVRNVVEACLSNKVRRLVHFSSIHAFKQSPLGQPLDETRELVDETGYAYDHSKALGIAEIHKGIAKGLDAVIVNPAGVIGPHDYYPSRMGEVFMDFYNGRLPAAVDGGFTWVDVRDVVQGALAAEEKGRTGEVYLLAGHYHTVLELSRMVGEVTCKKTPTMVTPMWLARAVAPFALWYALIFKKTPLFTPESLGALRSNKDVRHDKAKTELGFNPRPVLETVRDTFTWMKETGRV
jgi:dihydroflavonol-4-reductase